MSKIDVTYHNLLEKILQEGYTYEDPNRKGVNRIEIPSYTFRHEFKDGFPAITTKKLNYKSVSTELLWFLRGDTNIKYLVDNGCNIWNKDAYNNRPMKAVTYSFDEYIDSVKKGEFGDLGPVYGAQWREIYDKKADDISRYDQIKTLINTLKNNPLGTQHIVNAWNVLELDDMALQPCHYGFQIVVRPLSNLERFIIYKNNEQLTRLFPGITINRTNKLDELEIPIYGFELHWQQRSVDTFLGLPFNIASYATLALILEEITGYKALAIQGDLKKVHLYDNSLDAVKEQLSRNINKYSECKLFIRDHISFNEYNRDNNLNKLINNLGHLDFDLNNYESYPYIKCEMLERDE